MSDCGCIGIDIAPAYPMPEVLVYEPAPAGLVVDEVRYGFDFGFERVGGDMDFDIGIICRTDTGTETYLYVDDGCLVTIDGCFIKVMR